MTVMTLMLKCCTAYQCDDNILTNIASTIAASSDSFKLPPLPTAAMQRQSQEQVLLQGQGGLTSGQGGGGEKEGPPGSMSPFSLPSPSQHDAMAE